MRRLPTVALLMYFLASVWANPIDSKKEELVETPNTTAPVVVTEDPENSAVLTDHETGLEGEIVTEKGVKREDVKAGDGAEESSRTARNLGARNQVNEVGGTNHQLISDPEDALLQKLNNKCSHSDVSSCVMLKLVTYMNRLLKKSNIELFEGLHITQTATPEEVAKESQLLENPRSSGEVDEETQLSQLMANKLWTFVRSRSVRWSALPEADVVLSTSPDEDGALNLGMSIRNGKAVEKGRGKMKQMGPLIAAAAAKFALLGALAFKGLVLLVGKALLVSKIALLLAGILWLKKLFSHQKHVTYEVVAHPHHSHSSADHHGGESYSSGWGRSSEAQQLAYNAYAPGAKNQ